MLVPIDGDAGKYVSSHVKLDAMVSPEQVHKKVEVLYANVFNDKVVNNEAELKGTPFVVPEARHGGRFVESLSDQT